LHKPEFPFERNVDNVRRAVQLMRNEYPRVTDNDTGGGAMNRKRMLTIGIATVWLAFLGGLAISAQDSGQSKYTVKVPGGLAFSEFKGYESWQTISISRNERWWR
jgi:hypothetical protein